MSDNQKRITQANFFREWLEKLQQESWQLELLISGFALYGIWEAKPMIEQVSNYIAVNEIDSPAYATINLLLFILRAGWAIFFINLLFHIILRGLWIGAIGLRYVSQEIEYDELNYSDWMTEYLRRTVGDYDDYIERLERLCSVIFAYTFLLFFLLLSAMLFFAQIALIGFLVSKYAKNPYSITFQLLNASIVIYLFFGLIVFVDFITIGVFRKVKDKTFAKVYSYIYRFFSYATLSFLYRALLYNFLDNKYTRRLFLASIPYILIIVFIAPSVFSNGHPHLPLLNEMSNEDQEVFTEHIVSATFYDDLREKALKTGSKRYRSRIKTISLSQYEVTSNFLKVFLVLNNKDKNILEKHYDIPPIAREGIRLSFLDNLEEDSTYQYLELKRDKAISNIISDRKKARNLLKEKGLKSKVLIDSLDALFKPATDSIRLAHDEEYKALRRKDVARFKKAILDMYQLRIDGNKVAPITKNLMITKHTNVGEKGFEYFIPIDSLDQGPHLLSLEKKRWRSDRGDPESGSLSTYSTVNLPFVKMKYNQ